MSVAIEYSHVELHNRPLESQSGFKPDSVARLKIAVTAGARPYIDI